MTDLNGAVAVVTGGAAGLGRALALEAARRGARVLLADLVDASGTVKLIEEQGGAASWLETDVSDYASVQRLAEHAAERFGGVRILVNNAGTGAPAGLDTADPEAAARVFDVNIRGVFNGIRAFAETLKASAAASGSAYIMNVGSEHSLGVPPYVPPISVYTVSKYATLGLTDVARRDFAGTGVSVSLLAPGWVLTERVSEGMANSADFDALVRPYGQLPGEVAAAAFDGLLASQYLIVTNPKSIPFALEHAEAVTAELRRAASAGTQSDGRDRGLQAEQSRIN
jgi:NAD(P)-dependent dehydrogenase (short-subunit alcohol dehydrogenase family)